MKHFIYMMTLVLLLSSCEDIKERSLPDLAHIFISTHFPEAEFMYGEKDRDNGIVTFEVELSNGVDLEFAKSGDWISVDCEFTLMPEGVILLIPENISIYLTENHPTSKIVKIEKKMGGYEIGINNYLSNLLFAQDGTFVRYDT